MGLREENKKDMPVGFFWFWGCGEELTTDNRLLNWWEWKNAIACFWTSPSSTGMYLMQVFTPRETTFQIDALASYFWVTVNSQPPFPPSDPASRCPFAKNLLAHTELNWSSLPPFPLHNFPFYPCFFLTSCPQLTLKTSSEQRPALFYALCKAPCMLTVLHKYSNNRLLGSLPCSYRKCVQEKRWTQRTNYQELT